MSATMNGAALWGAEANSAVREETGAIMLRMNGKIRVVVTMLLGAAMVAGPAFAASVYDYTLNLIDGKSTSLGAYKGKVLLIVNVASKCGYTPQYASLEATYRKYKDRGLVVLGFPANNFGGQEPGTDEEIVTFCKRNYDVTFPMFSKVSVKGEDAAPLYKYLTTEANPAVAGDIKWNFTKFLVDREGKVVARFASGVKPDGPEITEAIEKLL